MMPMTLPRTILAVTLASLLSAGAGLAARADSDTSLCVMTFNLRYASARGPNAWPQRRPVMRDLIQKVGPDVMGTQEGLYGQLKDLAADLPGYAWIGTGRDGGSRGEFMAIFYRTERFEPMEYDHFWLSDTPEVIGSTTWGNSNRRMVTWVRFLDQQSRREFYFVNTHLDHEVQLAREKAAALIRKRVEGLNPNLPVLLVGDFNAAAQSNQAYEILTAGTFFTDTWLTAQARWNDGLSTFHDFKGPRPGPRIDWILARRGFKARSTEICTFSENGQFPSDHFPVVAWITWPD
jgi:endonuclease/exonuclease/phosphatase family metal-dependent hydrolase